MKSAFLVLLILAMMIGTTASAQRATSEKYGTTLNLGFGAGYYGYVGYGMPVFHADLELDVAKNFTLAPFFTYYSYQKNRYFQDEKKYYDYRVTVTPIGVKGSYYFDQALKANSKWDFYLAGSLGVAIRNTRWINGYTGDYRVNHGVSGLYLDGHIGTEYHLNSNLGLFLDLSTGLSTFGLAVHL